MTGPAHRAGHADLRSRLRSGCLTSTWLSLGCPAIVEVAAHAASDLIVLDLQHGLWDRASLESAVGLKPRDGHVIVRVAENAPTAIGQALDSGASGIIVPMVESAEQARRAVTSAYFPPRGTRSAGGVRPLLEGFDAYRERIEADLLVGAMIETARGLEQVESIVRAVGIDFVFIGTGDLAVSLKAAGAPDAAHEDACQHIRATCTKADMPCGIYTGTPDEAARRRGEGFRFVVTATDLGVLSQGFSLAAAQFNGSSRS